jgi:hypothetical protein
MSATACGSIEIQSSRTTVSGAFQSYLARANRSTEDQPLHSFESGTDCRPGRTRDSRDQQTGVRRGAFEALTWTPIVQAVSNVWNEPWEELLSARGTGARQTALFIGRIRGRLSLKELGQLAGGIHHSAVGIAIRRFTQRLQSDRALLEKVSLVQKELEPR